MEEIIRLACVRPLVRYVDEDQAVVETHVTLAHERHDSAPQNGRRTDRKGGGSATTKGGDEQPAAPGLAHVELQIELRGPDGSVTQHLAAVQLQNCHGMTRFELSTPHRWWPAGMGDQALYSLTVTLLVQGEPSDVYETTLGMTSVRPAQRQRALPTLSSDSSMLLINGQVCDIRTVVPVLPRDEGHILPAGGHSILLIQDHFGPDVLFEAADRAGILLVQSLPRPEQFSDEALARHVDRLAGHPSLAGWLVSEAGGWAGGWARKVVDHLRQLDPTRSVFQHH